jgi:hypothetical protein
MKFLNAAQKPLNSAQNLQILLQTSELTGTSVDFLLSHDQQAT